MTVSIMFLMLCCCFPFPSLITFQNVATTFRIMKLSIMTVRLTIKNATEHKWESAYDCNVFYCYAAVSPNLQGLENTTTTSRMIKLSIMTPRITVKKVTEHKEQSASDSRVLLLCSCFQILLGHCCSVVCPDLSGFENGTTTGKEKSV